jgi:hypothetical protein
LLLRALLILLTPVLLPLLKGLSLLCALRPFGLALLYVPALFFVLLLLLLLFTLLLLLRVRKGRGFREATPELLC